MSEPNTSPNLKAAKAPELSLPKGGGAIRGTGEKFAANPVDGTGSMTVPIAASPGRSGFGPQPVVSYNSGAANGTFGFGWNLMAQAISRKTDKGLPLYRDNEESDIFILSGAEDLTPALNFLDGSWTRDVARRWVHGREFEIHRYRPRVEGLFARIERWVNLHDRQDSFWRSISRDNVTTWFGRTAESRITDPADRSRIFSWLICETYDDRGNAMVYRYKPEDSAGIDVAQAHERNRSVETRSAQRYVKRIFYGNRRPYFPDLNAERPVAQPDDWCFELVFDYGEHDLAHPSPKDTGAPWICRRDPFSTYRPCFEVRTYRLCRRVLMFHHFPDEPNVGVDCLVRSTDFEHACFDRHDATQPFYSYLLSVTQRGYVRQRHAGYLAKSMPPVEFDYSRAEVDETVREADSESLENLPSGLDGTVYRWVDLDGEGVSGILSEQGGSWYYKSNLSPANSRLVNGGELTLPLFGPTHLVARQPVIARGARLVDMSGDGMLDVVDYEGATPGYYERTDEGQWRPFRTFRSLPVLDWDNPNMTFVDLTGDGFPDLLITEDSAFWWHESLSVDGFGPRQRVTQALDEEKGPRLIFADGTESIFLADLTGDGLNDLIRVRSGELAYWPNLGYGTFGAKVTMDGAPYFAEPDQFDARRIHFADIDGSGTADIIYTASDAIHLYFNRSGNAWGAQRTLMHFPAVDSASRVTVVDLLGNGTACLVWSSPLPGNAGSPLRYIDLMGGQKPHLLVGSRNNMGAETRVHYAPSTRFYVADKLAGTPWMTRLPFPVHVVERVESYDYINRNRFATRYAYHHGYFDGVEREFRGFGRVDQWDTEEMAALAGGSRFPQAANLDPAVLLPPVLTKTWYHVGAFFGEARVSRHFEQEYYAEGEDCEARGGLAGAQPESLLLEDTVLPRAVLLTDGTRVPREFSPEELRESCRALRGSILRQEVYALDGTNRADRPYSASERNYSIDVLQPQGPNRYGVFVVHGRESIDFHYDRALFDVVGTTLADPAMPPADALKAADPRVTHAFTLAVDAYGNVLQTASIAYGRRFLAPALSPSDQARQLDLQATYVANVFSNAIFSDDSYRAPCAATTSSYQLIQLRPEARQFGLTHLFRFDELRAKIARAGDGAHDIAYEILTPAGLNAGEPYRRRIGCARTFYRPDDLGVAANDPKALLPLGRIESLMIPGASFTLAFTPGLIAQVYQRAGIALLPTPADVLGSTSADGGGYIDLDGDGHWWIPSGRSFFLASPGTPAFEQAEATQHFFLPRRFEDPFGQATTVDYDTANDLLAVQTTDALRSTIVAVNDYRVLAPVQVTDPNGNRGVVAYDALGLVTGSAVMGKPDENLGDTLADFAPDPDARLVESFLEAADPHTMAAALLGSATTCVVYNVHRFYDSRRAAPDAPDQWRPVVAATLTRETHCSNLEPGQTTKIQIGFGYSDGLGREIQRKIQAERILESKPRWVGSGWTVFNNKGKPVRKFEPFFTDSHEFEFNVRIGISPLLFYDPVGRVVATLHPDHTWEKVRVDPWRQESWGSSDTALIADPAMDSDAGPYFSRIDRDEYLPTWYALRTDPFYASLASERWPDPTLRTAEADAARKTAVHAATPGVAHGDALGRTFLSVAHNRFKISGSSPLDPPVEQFYATRIVFDIEGNQREVIDARKRVVMRDDYGMLGMGVHQASMETGERWMLNDVSGKSILSWDSRSHSFRSEYDELRRPVRSFVTGDNSRHPNAETCVGMTIYGERARHAAPTLNLRGKALLQCDTAGIMVNVGVNPQTGITEAYDFKGNPLRSSRRLLRDYKTAPDWNGIDWSAVENALADDPWQLADLLAPFAALLEAESFDSSAVFDALNRPTALTTPDASVYLPIYNEASLLNQVSVNLRGATAATPFVANIDYDAKGRRARIELGNGARTVYSYDALTLRLKRLTSTRRAERDGGSNQFFSDASTVQNLAYTYDASGNITRIADGALPTLFFNNASVSPVSHYTYDAVYRLIEATGRESIGQSALQLGLPQATYRDYPFAGLGAQPFDPKAVRGYQERYEYDDVGNFLRMMHQAQNGNWQQDYQYKLDSLIEPGKQNNRLSSTVLHPNGGAVRENYDYDAHGNMTSMAHLPLMQWDFRDQLQASARQVATDNMPETTWYVYNAGGQRVRKVTERRNGTRKQERIYVGEFELYREYTGDGVTVNLERESLHVMDDKQRVALVDTRTRGEEDTPSQLMRYQFGNHLGSASLELDEAGRLISYEEYTPYGSTSYQAGRSMSEIGLKRYRYSGMERDEESGFNYHGARYYAPWLGRWIKADPSGLKGGANPYAYVNGRPINLVDLNGLDGTSPSVIDVLTFEIRQAAFEAGKLLETGKLIANLHDNVSLPAPKGQAVLDTIAGDRWWRLAYSRAQGTRASTILRQNLTESSSTARWGESSQRLVPEPAFHDGALLSVGNNPGGQPKGARTADIGVAKYPTSPVEWDHLTQDSFENPVYDLKVSNSYVADKPDFKVQSGGLEVQELRPWSKLAKGPRAPPGGGGIVSTTVNGVMTASIVLGAVKDLHEGHPVKAAEGLGFATVVVIVSKKIPIVGQLITVGLWGKDVLSAREEIAQSAADYAYENISDDHPFVGALVASGDAMKLAVFDRFFKPIGTSIGEGAAALAIEMTDSKFSRDMVQADIDRAKLGIPKFRH